ncbi:MAG: PepSY-associated TM helix domain-containing protein [Planctomycetota bacterium]|nr:PepSY-associated TM helix domain-containing protein [Planctomycetota bacterium]
MNVRRAIIAVHRDLGYFFTGFIIIFSMSGIALNHIDHWNPNFVIERQPVALELPAEPQQVTREQVLRVLEPIGAQAAYLSHDFPSRNRVKIYLKDGSVTGLLGTGEGEYETIRRRPFFYESNSLHVSPAGWWRWASDGFALGLITLALTGLFMVRGRAGFAGRGKWLVAAGLVLPFTALLLL